MRCPVITCHHSMLVTDREMELSRCPGASQIVKESQESSLACSEVYGVQEINSLNCKNALFGPP